MRIRWPVFTPTTITEIIDLASASAESRSRFSMLIFDLKPAAVLTKTAAGRAWIPLGLRMVFSVVRMGRL